ncbi:MAG: conjugal transfer protein TraF [Desulfuromonadaceae bacterium]|nr:conjugal transfer protein TraF [Desulfuromonadaceae bacterium]
MKKMVTTAALFGLMLPAITQAMEFQTPGTLGMGRAGVARTTDAYATFINPAGLAFYEKAFNMKLGAGVGVSISSSLADNADKIGKLDLGSTDMNYSTPAAAADATTKAVQFAAIVDDLAARKGNLAVNVDIELGFQFQNYGLGVFGVTELGAGVKDIDKTNLRIGTVTSGGSTATNVNTLAINVVNPAYTNVSQITAADAVRPSTQIFSQAQYDQIVAAFQTAGGASVTTQTAQALASKLEAQLAANNTTNLTPEQLVSALNLTATTLNPTNDTIDNNQSTVLLSGLAVVEVPLAYGHKFDLGNFGKLGIGGAVKAMQGSVYYNVVKVSELKDSKDTTTKAKDQHEESTQIGVDLGALWRMEDVAFVGPVSVGLALKNLNSPTFDGPKDPATGAATGKVKVEPQARLGVALDPLSWLSLAADMDLTKNKTVIHGRDSQLIGGGLEAHFDHWYAVWLALRAGMYKNIGEDGSKPIITAGLSLGPQWLRFDLNGAFATEKAKYDNKSYPNEAKVEFGLSTSFF